MTRLKGISGRKPELKQPVIIALNVVADAPLAVYL